MPTEPSDLRHGDTGNGHRMADLTNLVVIKTSPGAPTPSHSVATDANSFLTTANCVDLVLPLCPDVGRIGLVVGSDRLGGHEANRAECRIASGAGGITVGESGRGADDEAKTVH